MNAVKLLPMSEERVELIKQITDSDEVLQDLKKFIHQGWPDTRERLPTTISPYFVYREELSIYDGLIFKGERLLIPEGMRKEIKEQLHRSHIGTNGCLRRARECMFWPGMSAEIKEYIQ